MATFTPVAPDELRSFLSDYGLDLVQVCEIPQGSVNSNYRIDARDGAGAVHRLFLRLYEEQGAEGAQEEARLLARLEAGGVPTPAPIAPVAAGQSGERERRGPIGRLSGKPAALFPWRDGTMRCQAAVSPADVYALGAALARVHLAGAGLSRGPGRFRRVDLERRLDAIAAADDPKLRAHAGPLRAHLAENDAARDRTLPTGLVHGDLFRDNVLFDEDGALAALLDFESAFDGTFAFDLSVCVLAWSYGRDFEFALGRALVRGYESVRPLTKSEQAGLYEETRFAALRFTVTRITDFAMRASSAPTTQSAAGVMKDYRRFWARFERLGTLGREGLCRALGVIP